MSETIIALASGMGRAGVAVLRVSGSRSWESLKSLTRRSDFQHRSVQLCILREPDSRETLDQAMVLPFQAPASYTGEDVVEYHVHGGRAVIDSVMNVLIAQDGHRLAEPGEFTRRAFENGKMDLTAAEAVADLIDAETQAQKIQALSQMDGRLLDLYEGWMGRLKKSLAHLEADIEFPDEDMPEGVAPEISQDVVSLIDEIAEHLDDNRRGERLRDGVQVAVIGAPNAGKSSLINALAKRDVAIISDVAGTTRDVIEVHLDLKGYPVILADTAGLRPEQLGDEGHDAIESEGIRRAMERAERADIKILVFDGTSEMPDPYTLNLIDDRSILVTNKMDQSGANILIDTSLPLSVTTGKGFQELLDMLFDKIDVFIGKREVPSLTRQRHRQHVENALESLQRSRNANLPELMAEDLRLATRDLGRISGRVDVEDLLDVIFKDFCIGK